MAGAYAHQYRCGCVFHSIAGFISRCPGQVSRSLSGRLKSIDEGSAAAHKRSMTPGKSDPEPIVQTYELAGIMP